MIIDGKLIAKSILDNLAKKVETLKKKHITPHLTIILIGDDPASVAYVRQKQQKAEIIGAKATVIHFPVTTTQQELLATIENCNNDTKVHGIIVQRPLPHHIDNKTVDLATDLKKDIDAFHKDTLFDMPLAAAVIKILKEVYKFETRISKLETNSNNQKMNNKNVLNIKHSNFDIVSDFRFRISDFIFWLKAKKVVVIGKGQTGGWPVIEKLKKLDIKPTVIDSKTESPEILLHNADIIISAVGKPHVIKPEMLKKDVILLAVGMYRGADGKLHGDYNEEQIKNIASFYTPIPGGVGPVNVAMLLQNLLIAAKNQ